MVLAQTGEDSRKDYGNTLLKVLEQFEHRNSLAGIVGILENKGPVEQRIRHISRFTRGAYRWSLLAVVLLGGIALFFLTSPKAPKNPTVADGIPAEDQSPQYLFNKKIFNLRLDPIRVNELSLTEFSQALAKKFQDKDPDHTPTTIEVLNLSGSPSLRVSLDLKNPTVEEVYRELARKYAIQPDIVGVGKITLTLNSPDEIAFRKRASETSISIKFNSTPLKEALVILQKLAAEKGLRFDFHDFDKVPTTSRITVDLKNYPMEKALRAVCYLGGIGFERKEGELFYKFDPALRNKIYMVKVEIKFVGFPSGQVNSNLLQKLESDFLSGGLDAIQNTPGIELTASPSVVMPALGSCKVEQGELSVNLFVRASMRDLNIVATPRINEQRNGEGKILQELNGNWNQTDGQAALLGPAMEAKVNGVTNTIFPVITSRLTDPVSGEPLLPLENPSQQVIKLQKTNQEYLNYENTQNQLENKKLGPFQFKNLPLPEFAALMEKRLNEKIGGSKPFAVKIRELNGASSLKVTLALADPTRQELVLALSKQKIRAGQKDSTTYLLETHSAEDIAFELNEYDLYVSVDFKSVSPREAFLVLQKMAAERGFSFGFIGLDQLPKDKKINLALKNYPIHTALHAVALRAGVDLAREENETNYSFKAPGTQKTFLVRVENQSLRIPFDKITPVLLKKLEKDFLSAGPDSFNRIAGAELVTGTTTVVLPRATGGIQVGKAGMSISTVPAGEDLSISVRLSGTDNPDATAAEARWNQKNGQQYLLLPPLESHGKSDPFYTASLLKVSLVDLWNRPLLPFAPSNGVVTMEKSIQPASLQSPIPDSITSRSLSESDFRKKSRETLIDVKIDNSPANSALHSIQQLAALKGFIFKIESAQGWPTLKIPGALSSTSSNPTSISGSTLPINLDLKQYPVEKALRAVAYLAGLGVEGKAAENAFYFSPEFPSRVPGVGVRLETKFIKVPADNGDKNFQAVLKNFLQGGIEKVGKEHQPVLLASKVTTIKPGESSLIDLAPNTGSFPGKDVGLRLYLNSLSIDPLLKSQVSLKLYRESHNQTEILQQFAGSFVQGNDQQLLLVPVIKIKEDNNLFGLFCFVTSTLVDAADNSVLFPTKTSYGTANLAPVTTPQAKSKFPPEQSMVEVKAEILEIPLSNRSEEEVTAIRAALDSGDINSIFEIKGSNIFNAPSVNMPANNEEKLIQITRELRFPNKYEKESGQPMTPVNFEAIDVGIKIHVKASTQDGAIMLSGKMEIRDFMGLTQGENNMGASFNTRESLFNALLQENTPRIVNHFTSQSRQTIEDSGKKREVLLEKETVLILSAKNSTL